ncbi:Uroporphyrinogen-III synthase [Planococcus halocryophilus Or1]|uniref:Uroporphyrinogen-III synthase n=1 Tax=Planococcus halocryophilus TaxID=1215089 RepID=A0A1C7DVK0_9BACL|nr:uroporphyrinogen-III synthase [Planococcus halocryophilus]ANU15434.1 uroporphyrinogen-III synthase [Planococcus halocryophilus]EMF48018.1 Uroporphyrinogen-III synthase [Planococcus halocryophilus Or1]
MSNSKKLLEGKTIVFTGSRKPVEAISHAQSFGAITKYVPLVETIVRQSQKPDFTEYDWLIFTSRTSAEVFCSFNETVSAKIAAVGNQTAAVLERHGHQVEFIPKVFSADQFIQEFPPVSGRAKCLFIKGQMAKNTISTMSMQVDEWTVYDTALNGENAKTITQFKDVIVLFASPSAVKAYRQAGGNWSNIQVAAIGHVTKKAITDNGGTVDFMPERYTYIEVINEIAKGSLFT